MTFVSAIPARAALAALLALSTSPLLAKSHQTSCKALADRLLAEKTTADTRITEDAQGCVFTNLKIPGKFRGWTVDRLTVYGPDFRSLKKGQLLPSALQVEAHGVRFAPDIGESHARYILQLQQRPFDARLSYAWDKATQQLHVRELALDSPAIGLIAVSLDADLGDLDKRAAVPEPRDLGIRHVRMVLDNAGLFESMLMPPLVAMIPTDKDPAEEIPKAKERERARIRTLPASVIDDASKDALLRFVADFPHPKGHIEIDQTFDKPLQLGDLKAMFSTGTPAWLQGSRLTVRYDPSAIRPAVPIADTQNARSGIGQ